MRKILLLTVCLSLACATIVAAQDTPRKSTSVITIAGERFYVHTVAAGETFYSLGKLYDVEEADIRRNNPHTANGLKAGQVVKIPARVSSDIRKMSERKRNRLFDTHVVNQGETAYAISKRYGVSLNVLMEDNPGFDPAHLSIGQKINVRIKSQGQTDEQTLNDEMASYRDALNSVSDRFEHHVVEQGETLYSLSRQWNVSIDTIEKYNPAETKNGLKTGSILRIPVPDKRAELPSADGGNGREPLPPSEFPSQDSSVTAELKQIDVTAPIRVAAMLPLKVGAVSNRQFLEFYQGMLVALDELKGNGISARLDLYNTGKSPEEVGRLLGEADVQDADLIIGPVYDVCFAVAADFGARKGIPVVSPLAAVETADNGLLFQVYPDERTKYDKLKEELTDAKNVIVISSSARDEEFARGIDSLLPASAVRIDYSKGMPASAIEGKLRTDKENVFVVLSANENTTDEILARISSVHNNLVARSLKNPVIRVIGSSRWARFQNVDKNLFFKLNVRYLSSYHADRGNERVKNFDRRYVSAFGTLPSLYSYRGYDVTKLFVSALKLHGREFVDYVNENEMPLLQTPYRFVRSHPQGKFTNDQWALVCFNGDYTITVK